jgi:hypothetical protein
VRKASTSTYSYRQPSYIRQDALRLLDSLEKGNPPVMTVWDKTRYQTLSEARRSLLLSPERFSSVVMAILKGRLSPVGRTPSIAGILGYIFSNIELQMHSHTCVTTSNSDTNLNQGQAARFLGIPRNKFCSLVASGMLPFTSQKAANGFQEFIFPTR